MRKNLLLLGFITTIIIASSDVIAAGKRENNNLGIKSVQSEKIEGIDGFISESVVDSCNNIYFVAFSNEDFLYKYDIYGNFTKIIIDNEERSFSNVIADSNCNIYFISRLTTQQGLYELYVLKQEAITATKINGINHNVDIIYLDNNDNVYIGTFQYGSYMINNGTTNAKKIEYLHRMADDNLFLVDKNNTVYFVNRVLPNDEICYLTEEEILKPNPTVKTINGITNSRAKYVKFMLSDNNNNIYIGTTGGLFKINANDQQVTTILTDAVDHAVIDRQNNIYYSSYATFPYSGYITTNSGITLKIKGLDNLAYIINDIQIDSNDNVYFVAIRNGIFILIFGETTATKMKGISSDVEVKKIKIDEKNNAYIITTDEYNRDSFYVLERNKDFPERISGISSFFKTIVFRGFNTYIGTGKGVYLVGINK